MMALHFPAAVDSRTLTSFSQQESTRVQNFAYRVPIIDLKDCSWASGILKSEHYRLFFFAIIAMAMNVKRKESMSMLQEYG